MLQNIFIQINIEQTCTSKTMQKYQKPPRMFQMSSGTCMCCIQKQTSKELSVPPLPLQQIQTQNNTNCNNTINCTQNIYINNFGSENISHVSKEFLDKCLLNLKRGVCDYIEKVNFNPDVPENHTIRFEDARSVKVKESDDTRNLQPTVQTLIKNRCRELENHYESNDEIRHVDTNIHFNIIRDHLQYLMTGVKKEVQPVFDHIVALLRELENTYNISHL